MFAYYLHKIVYFLKPIVECSHEIAPRVSQTVALDLESYKKKKGDKLGTNWSLGFKQWLFRYWKVL